MSQIPSIAARSDAPQLGPGARPPLGASESRARWVLALLRGGPAALLAVLALLLTAACAGPGTERNLAPLFSSFSAADKANEVEAVGGMLLTRRDPTTGKRNYWAVRPLVSNRYADNGDRFSWFLPPAGYSRDDASAGTRVAQLLPIARYQTVREASGFLTWSLLILPGIYWAGHEDGRVQRAFFPIYGYVEKFLSFDSARFLLFPLWFQTQRYGRTTNHFLFPIFSESHGTGGWAWRVWPIIGNNAWEGRYDRWFAAWPFLHFQRNGLQFPEDQQQRSWMAWPLVGRSRRGPGTQTTVLWPFFGRTTDPETGFWAWDGPWPLVRFQGGDPDRAVRKRVWPFYSFYEGGGLRSRWYAWPFVNLRHETYPDGTKKSFNVLPFWRSYNRERRPLVLGGEVIPQDEPVGTKRRRKLWPLGKMVTGPGYRDVHIVDLNPFQEFSFVNEHYSWLWELYGHKERGDTVRSRSLLGLWRREKDKDEDRRSLSALWSARDYTRAGAKAHERSWLFGLIRYRTVEGRGFTLLRPAFPGPGWPIQRTPSSMPSAISKVRPTTSMLDRSPNSGPNSGLPPGPPPGLRASRTAGPTPRQAP